MDFFFFNFFKILRDLHYLVIIKWCGYDFLWMLTGLWFHLPM